MPCAQAYEYSCHCLQVLFFDCPEKTREERLTECDKTSGRNDDNPETMRKRFQHASGGALSEAGKLHKISAATGTPNKTFLEVQKILPAAATATA